MGSRNLGISTSMPSDEFAVLNGHSYAVHVNHMLPLLHFEADNESINTNFGNPDGKFAHLSLSLEQLQNTNVQNGVLKMPENTHKETLNVPRKTDSWSSIVNKSVVDSTPCLDNEDTIITYNEDGTAVVKFSREYMVNAQKKWDNSIIGHFIGGGFAFKFVREQAHRIWRNKGLTGVFYSSKGYYTFRFGTKEERNVALNLNTVQIGGKTLYLMPWMEGSKFKRNVVAKVPCWIRLVDVPYSHWSKNSLSAIARVL